MADLLDDVLFMEEVERRYHYDSLLHARAHQTMQIVDADLHRRTGERLTKEDESLALLAAAVALVAAEHPDQFGRVDVEPTPNEFVCNRIGSGHQFGSKFCQACAR